MKASVVSLGLFFPTGERGSAFKLPRAPPTRPAGCHPPRWLPLWSITLFLTQVSLPKPLTCLTTTSSFCRDSNFMDANPDRSSYFRLSSLRPLRAFFGGATFLPRWPALPSGQRDLYWWNSCKKSRAREVVFEAPFKLCHCTSNSIYYSEWPPAWNKDSIKGISLGCIK